MKRKPVASSDSFWGDLANALALRPVYRRPLAQIHQVQPSASTSSSGSQKRQKSQKPTQKEAKVDGQHKPDSAASSPSTVAAVPALTEQNIDDEIAAAVGLLVKAIAKRGRAPQITAPDPESVSAALGVEKRILVNAPVSTAYHQWTQFEEFPHFMGGVKSVTQLSDDRLEWVAEIGGVRQQWEAKILEQVPDRKVAWAATEGVTNAGVVEFEDLGGGQTAVQLTLEYEPEGLIEKVGDKLKVIDRQAEADLQRFKEFIEDEGYASGAWRGTVNPSATVGTPGVEDAAASLGGSGEAGASGMVAGGPGVAAAAGAAAGTNKGTTEAADETVTPTVPGEPVTMTPQTTDTTTDTRSTGTTTDTASTGTTTTGTTAAAGSTGSVADLGDDRIGHAFDQTNGLADTTGESGETLEGEN